MLKPQILISGPTISTDVDLVTRLQGVAHVLKSSQNSRIEALIKDEKVALILVEILKEAFSDLKVIKRVKNNFPEVAILLIDGDRELMAEAFSYGVKDAFRKPYESSLVVERVKAVLGGIKSYTITKKA